MCDCFTKVNLLLREHNTAIDLCDTINMRTGNYERRMTVPTTRIDKKKRAGPLRVFATFCPMCGEKYPEREGATSPVSETLTNSPRRVPEKATTTQCRWPNCDCEPTCDVDPSENGNES